MSSEKEGVVAYLTLSPRASLYARNPLWFDTMMKCIKQASDASDASNASNAPTAAETAAASTTGAGTASASTGRIPDAAIAAPRYIYNEVG